MEHEIPEFPGYYLTDEYEVVSYKRGFRKVMTPQIMQHLTVKTRKNVVYHMQQNGKQRCMYLQRIILAVKLGRLPYAWEQARHKDGNPNNNTFENIQVGCALLNIIDCLESGARQTCVDNINIAIERLEKLKLTYLS